MFSLQNRTFQGKDQHMFKKKDGEQEKGKKPADKKQPKKEAKPKKEKAPREKKVKEKKIKETKVKEKKIKEKPPKKEKAPRQKPAPKEGGGKKTGVVVAILLLVLLVAVGSVFYPSLIGNKKQPVPSSLNANKSAQQKMRSVPAGKPGPAATIGKPAKIDEETGETPDDQPEETAVASSAPPALPTPVKPATPPGKTAAPAPSAEPAPPAPLPAAGSGALIPPPSARMPIAVRIPPMKEKIPAIAVTPDKVAPPSYSVPAPKPDEKETEEKVTIESAGVAVAKNPNRKTPHFNKSKDERKTIIDEKDDVFIPRGSMDDLFSWPAGKSFGSSKSLNTKSPNSKYSTVSDINPELKLEKTFYMVLIKESNDVEELRRLASKMKLHNPAPEIKATVSFGRPIYWLTVGHYTSEYKAFNKAHEISERGFPTTIVSEDIYY